MLAGAGAAASLATAGTAGCSTRTPTARPGTPAAPDALLAGTPGGLVLLRDGKSLALGDALVTPDGSRILRAVPVGADTDLITLAAATGAPLAAQRLTGRWSPRATSRDGGYLALTAPQRGGTTGYAPSAQDRTPMVLLDAGRPRYLTLAGNYVPDAFAADGALYVLDWQPAQAPDHYRVRELAPTTEIPTPLLSRAKVPIPAGAEELMRGEGRLAAYRPDLSALYTLYTHQPDHTHTRDLLAGTHNPVGAFVHTLTLDQHWAYCVDLPAPFGDGPAEGHTITTAGDGAVYVADTGSGRLARIDPDSLSVAEVASVPTGTGTASAASTATRLYLAAGTTIRAIDRATLTVAATWPVAGVVSGLATSADGTLLYVGQPDQVLWLDAGTGARRGALAVPGLRAPLRRL